MGRIQISFLRSHGILHGVHNDKFRKRNPPTDKRVNWIVDSQLIGTAGWSGFQHLFFMADGQLYGVHGGKLYRDAPPTVPYEDWLSEADVIGSGGWSIFKFLVAPLK